MALRLMPMKRTDRPGLCSPGRPGWNKPTTPWRLSPTRSRMILVLPSSTGTLSDGISGMPRQVRNWRAEQADGGRRHAAAGALAAEGGDGQRVGQEEGGFLPDLGQQVIQVVRGGGAGQRREALVVVRRWPAGRSRRC
jgi:hypothetical protein